jgi:hypothetical protein
MSGKRIGIGARPLTDSQAKAWIRQGAAFDHGKAERYSARLTLDVTLALRTGGLRPRREHGGDAARGAEAAGHVMTPGTHQTWRPLTLPAGSIFALVWAALATSLPRLIYNTSDSVPAGWYRTSPANSLAPGDLMLVHLMQWLRSTATC